ncbi:uncharacterized protein LOC129593900 [Paramacrobiotus metropolitanus]|uniref:uncharacterized protein LOC129593900 n=1 Tax=Paramacrobiotus metropolitanus TaxID=2943436 RepID=UPI0024458789|nr:uncharacterized protein LOC129593900 [Paramacrobiotus metropolitanus]XP_055346376.1 uncharacterized protein LOC129593900 [Paramacrobiotus metropolitanus]XP_055346377.1 uncharacterized protein LOC129593900 [Paramacrobiotus metropolitanus]XP_055346379.1 uncharacterized protein LOC129593900 [Paramacrobiotus metropolitanus]
MEDPFTQNRLTVHRLSTASPSGSNSPRERKNSATPIPTNEDVNFSPEFAVSSLTYRDFFPRMLEEGSSFSSPTYEEFGILVARANEWLSSHREFEILNVECVEILALHNTKTVDPNKASYFETMKDWTEFVRGLRMWLIPALSRNRQTKPGYLRYFDVVPECTHAGIVSIEYTRLGVLVEALNDKLRNSPINGDVLAVQTLTLRFHSNEAVDSNRTCFSLHGQKQKIRLYFLRVFYLDFGEEIPGMKVECMEEVGIADFVPQIMRQQVTSRQHIEPLSSVVTRAGDWFIRYQEDDHPGLRIVNIQTVVLHVKDNKNIDTQTTFYMSSGDGERFLYELRFIRLIYARQTHLVPAEMPTFPRVFLKMFVPTPQGTGDTTHHGKRQPKFNNLQDLVGKVQEWISADHPPIIGIETHGYSSYVGDEIIITAESPYLYDQGHQDKFWIQSVRVYYEGDYVESSQELPSPGRLRDRRGSSVRNKQPLEARSSTGVPSWPPLAATSTSQMLNPEVRTNGRSASADPSPRSPRRRSSQSNRAEDVNRDRDPSDNLPRDSLGRETPKSDKDCSVM